MLTTKDGFCDTLRSLHLPLAELWSFTFPCWILPRDLLPLAQRLQEAAEAPEAEEGAADALGPCFNAGTAHDQSEIEQVRLTAAGLRARPGGRHWQSRRGSSLAS